MEAHRLLQALTRQASLQIRIAIRRPRQCHPSFWDFPMDDLSRPLLKLAATNLWTANLPLVTIKELSVIASSMDRAKWGTRHPQVEVAFRISLCHQLETRFPERRSSSRSTPRSSSLSARSAFTQAKREKIDIFLFQLHSRSFSHLLSSFSEKMWQEARTWDHWRAKRWVGKQWV